MVDSTIRLVMAQEFSPKEWMQLDAIIRGMEKKEAKNIRTLMSTYDAVKFFL